MSINYNDDYTYANAKLSDSIILHKGQPTYIASVSSEGLVEYRFLGQDRGKFKTDHLKHFDLTPVPLGYANIEDGSAAYVTRLPTRSWKQGLQMRQLVTDVGRGVRLSMESSAFLNMLWGHYPKIQQCIEFLANEEAKAMAFARMFALTLPSKKGVSNLLYKDIAVGHINIDKDQTTPELWGQFSFLRETLEEVINENRAR